VSIVLHIDRVVVDECLLGKETGAAVRAALERELAARLASHGVAGSLSGIGSIDALPAVPMAPARPRQHLGARIAAAVAQGLAVRGAK
jgi:hypothetical protein